jgi:choline dehydrogenase-like flavoprotein
MLSWLGRISPRFENGISFSDEHSDWCGMPAPTIVYTLDEVARAESQTAGRHVDAAASALGTYVARGEPRMVPAGWSFHYMGTTRMGERNDGTSVCDARSRVWGFENLFVGGNGVIPTATACNPTLMSVGLAAHSVVDLVSVLQ